MIKFFNDDHYELIDKKIISSINEQIVNQILKFETIQLQSKTKRKVHFGLMSTSLTMIALVYGAQLMDLVPKYAQIRKYSTIELGIKDYQPLRFTRWTNLYRKFIWSYRETNQNRVLNDLYRKIEKVYSNDWLLTINNQWQETIDRNQ